MKLTKLVKQLGIVFITASAVVNAQTLNVYLAGPQQRPDVYRRILDEYEKKNPGVFIKSVTQAANGDVQAKLLRGSFADNPSAFDLFLLDTVNVREFQAKGLLAPVAIDLNQFYSTYKVTPTDNTNKPYAVPAFAELQVLYYRKDLLDKAGVTAPKTFVELVTTAKKLQGHVPRGLVLQGDNIEAANCTFLYGQWGSGYPTQRNNVVTLDKPSLVKGLEELSALVTSGVVRADVSEIKPMEILREFKGGNAAFAINWTFMSERLDTDTDSKVKGKWGVAPLPAFKDGFSTSCLGGRFWGMSPASKNPVLAEKLLQHLTSKDVMRRISIEGGLLPSRPDAAVGLPEHLDVPAKSINTAGVRIQHPKYDELSPYVTKAVNDFWKAPKVNTPTKTVDNVVTHLKRFEK